MGFTHTHQRYVGNKYFHTYFAPVRCNSNSSRIMAIVVGSCSNRSGNRSGYRSSEQSLLLVPSMSNRDYMAGCDGGDGGSIYSYYIAPRYTSTVTTVMTAVTPPPVLVVVQVLFDIEVY